jgi:hypothetical protein
LGVAGVITSPDVRAWREQIIARRLTVYEAFRLAVAAGDLAIAARRWNEWMALGERLRLEERARIERAAADAVRRPLTNHRAACHALDDDQFARLWTSRYYTSRQIATRDGCSVNSARGRARRLGLPDRARGPRPMHHRT